MAGKTVAQKARVKPDATIAVINRVPGIVESLGLPNGVAFVKPAAAQLIFLFVRTRAELEAKMPPAVAAPRRPSPRSGCSSARARRTPGST